MRVSYWVSLAAAVVLLAWLLAPSSARPGRLRRDRGTAGRDLRARSRADLYAEAKRLGVPGRSRMDKAALARAIAARGPTGA